MSKYADHLPLPQAQIYARHGIALDRRRADWVAHAAICAPLQRLLTVLGATSKLFAGETTAPVLDPDRGAPRSVSSELRL
ncbi:IS66 family transposase [Bradyrhizobium huanghuaihaiense]|uniref:IS66 family transposase n=1 Tax=Bradyrhizobium huanghuaihaiense TaxID=990078 RepID=UPI003CC5AF8D